MRHRARAACPMVSVAGDRADPRARDHRVLDVAVGEVEDAVEHHRQLRRQVPALPRLLDDVLQVAGGGGVLDVVHRLDPQGAQQQVRGLVEHPDQPAEQPQVEHGRARQPQGDRLGPGDGEVLREQLAEEHLHDGGEQQGQHRADADADRRSGMPTPPSSAAERLTDQRLGDVADQQAGDGDAQLGAGEHERGAPGDRQRARRRRRHRPRRGRPASSPVDRHVGELLGHEVAGDHGDAEHHEHAERAG